MYIKQSKQPLKIVDTFFESPMLWKQFALKQEYFKDQSGYPGKKTKSLDEIDDTIFHCIAGKIIKHTNGKQGFQRLKIQFAYTLGDDFVGNIHQDEPFYNVAGLIFLNENAPLNTGTKFFKNQNGEWIETLNVENVCNRMIIFDPSVWHAPAGSFGSDLDTARITITFFGVAV